MKLHIKDLETYKSQRQTSEWDIKKCHEQKTKPQPLAQHNMNNKY